MTDAFEEGMAQLCAAFDKPLTPGRLEAYRKSFGQLHPEMWMRLVTHCVGRNGPEKLPSTSKLWVIYKRMRYGDRPKSQPVTAPMPPAEMTANLALLRAAYGSRRGMQPMGDKLDACLKKKREIISLYNEAERTGYPWADDELIETLATAFEKILGTGEAEAQAKPVQASRRQQTRACTCKATGTCAVCRSYGRILAGAIRENNKAKAR